MGRKVEVRVCEDGEWRWVGASFKTVGEAQEGGWSEARYVGGVLEFRVRDGGYWGAVVDEQQCLTPAECACGPWERNRYEYRLRPYEDGAPTAPDPRHLASLYRWHPTRTTDSYVCETCNTAAHRVNAKWWRYDGTYHYACDECMASERMPLRVLKREDEWTLEDKAAMGMLTAPYAPKDGGIATQMAELADAAAQSKTTADQFREAYRAEAIRANRLADECGELRDQNAKLKVRLFDAEGEIERLKRKR